VGAGPTGIQFAFEMAHVLLACHAVYQLNLIDGSGQVTGPFPPAIGRYVEKRLSKNASHYLKAILQGQTGTRDLLVNSHSGDKSVQPLT